MYSELRYGNYDLVERMTVALALVMLSVAIGITFNEAVVVIILATVTTLPILLFPLSRNYVTIGILYMILILVTYIGVNSLRLLSGLVVMVSILVAITLTIIQLPAWVRYLMLGVCYVLIIASTVNTYSIIYIILGFLTLVYISARAYSGSFNLPHRYPSWLMFLLALVPVIIVVLSRVLNAVIIQALPSVLASFVLTMPLVKSNRVMRAFAIVLSLASLFFMPLASLILAPSLTFFRRVRYHRGIPPPETWVDAWIGGRYYIERVIDIGGFSYVLLGRYGNERYAIKVLRFTSPSNTPLASDMKVVQSFKREMTSYLLVNSDRVVKVYEIHINEDKLPYRSLESYLEDPPYIVMDYMEHGSLRRYLKEVGRLSLSEAVRIAYEVALALKELHSMGMLHLDLKPENILFKDKDRKVIKLGDLGASRIYTGHSVEISQFSLAYSAPEVLMSKAASDRADIYSLGLILYEMLMGFNPQQYVLRGIMPHIDPSIPAPITNLIVRSLSIDPNARPSIDEFIMVLGTFISNTPKARIN